MEETNSQGQKEAEGGGNGGLKLGMATIMSHIGTSRSSQGSS